MAHATRTHARQQTIVSPVARSDRGAGLAGVTDSTLLNARCLGGSGGGSLSDIADGVQWPTDAGADIINMSLGGGGYTETLKNAVEYADDRRLRRPVDIDRQHRAGHRLDRRRQHRTRHSGRRLQRQRPVRTGRRGDRHQQFHDGHFHDRHELALRGEIGGAAIRARRGLPGRGTSSTGPGASRSAASTR